MISMLETALQSGSGREIVYIHAARSGRHHAMKEHVDELTRTHDNLRSYFIYETAEAGENPDKTGYIDLPWLKSVTDTGSDFYFCGPLPFMKAINRVLKEWGVPGERIHFEFFGPADSLEDTMSK